MSQLGAQSFKWRSKSAFPWGLLCSQRVETKSTQEPWVTPGQACGWAPEAPSLRCLHSAEVRPQHGWGQWWWKAGKASFKAQCVKTAETSPCFSEQRTEFSACLWHWKMQYGERNAKEFVWKCFAQLWSLSALGAQALGLALGKDLRTYLFLPWTVNQCPS